MKKFIKPAVIILLCLAAAGGGVWYYLTPDTVEVVMAIQGRVSPMLSGTGKVEGEEKVTVYSSVDGIVSERFAQAGERVSAGDLLISYASQNMEDQVLSAATDVEYSEKILNAASNNRASYQKKYNEAAQQVENCKSVYAYLEYQIMSLNLRTESAAYHIKEQQKVYESDIDKMQTEIADKQTELAKIEADLKAIELKEDGSGAEDAKEIDRLRDRSKEIQNSIKKLNDSISSSRRASLCLPQEDMDPETYRQYTVYQNDLETVTKLWSDARTDMDTSLSMLTAYQEIYADEQSLAQNRLSLSKAERELAIAQGGTVSPVDGVIMDLYVDAGAFVEKGEPVADMQSDASYKAVMMVSKYDVSSVKEGQSAEIRIGDQIYQGTVTKIRQSAESDASGKAKASVEIRIDTDEDLIIGLEADVTLTLDAADNVLRVPVGCVYTDDGGSYVYVVEENVVEKKYVTTGLRDSDYIQVEDLASGAHVVTDPDADSYVGQKVEERLLPPVEIDPAAAPKMPASADGAKGIPTITLD